MTHSFKRWDNWYVNNKGIVKTGINDNFKFSSRFFENKYKRIIHMKDCKIKLIRELVPTEIKKRLLTLSTPVIFPKHSKPG